MALTVGELVGYLRLDSSQWTRTLVKARKQLGDADSDLRRFGRSSEVLAGAAVRMGAMSAATSVAGSAMSGLVAGAAAASGALLVLPAAGLAGAAAFGALKIGASGFGEALSNIGDPEKFAESIADLAPSAQEAAKAVAGLKPRFDELRTSVQDRLFADLAPQITALGNTYLPILDERFGRIADAANGAGRSVALMLTETSRVNDVKGIGDAAATSFENLSGALGPVSAALLDVAAVGSDFLPGLTEGARSAALSLQQFVAQARESGQLQQWIQGGIEALSTLGSIAGNVGSALGSIFSAMSSNGGGALAALDDLTGRLAAFLSSAEGSTALGQIFAGLSAAASGLVPALTSVVSALVVGLAPVVAQLGPAIGQLAQQVGATLVTAVQLASPLLLQLATFLQQNMSWLGPLTIALVGFSAAIGPTISVVMGLVNAFKAVTLILQVLRVAMLTNPFTAIITAVLLLTVLIVSNWDTIKSYLLAAWEWIKSTAASVWGGIVAFFTDTWNSITATISGALSSVSNWVSSTWARVTGFFRSAWTNIANAVSSGVSNVVGFVRSLPGRILDALGNLGSLLVDSGRSLLEGLWRGISGAVGWLKGKVSGVLSSIRNLFPFSPAKEGPFSGSGYTTYSGEALTRDFAGAISDGGDRAVTAADAVAGRVRAALAPGIDAPRIAAPGRLAYAGGSASGMQTGPAGAQQSADAPLAGSRPITPEELREALSGMTMTLDERGGRLVARMVNRINTANARR